MLMFLLLAGTGLAAHGRVTYDAAVASSLILQHSFPSIPATTTGYMVWIALLTSMAFSFSAAWLSARHERPAGLIGMMATGILCWWSTHAFGDGNLGAAWIALASLAGSVLFALYFLSQIARALQPRTLQASE